MGENVVARRLVAAAAGVRPDAGSLNNIERNQRVLKHVVMNFSTRRLGKS